ncbi:hypothetical protein AAHE18_09G019000 [Arachis hypogaea]|nr:uncharacterized protein DS421_9g255380 [Arachis hypogaea]
MAANFTRANLLSLFLLVLAICSVRIEVSSGGKERYCQEEWPVSYNCLSDLCSKECKEKAKERGAPFMESLCQDSTCFCHYKKEC